MRQGFPAHDRAVAVPGRHIPYGDAVTVDDEPNPPVPAMWSAPGRVNLIGEHTDYNDGFVLPIAIPLTTTCTARTRRDGRVRASSRQYPEQPADMSVRDLLDDWGAVPEWSRYPLGVVAELLRRGHRIDGLDLALDSTVPVGAGLSSSAALCCSVVVAVRDLCASEIGERELIDIAQTAENHYAGVPTGVLDHAASILGTAGHALYVDIRRFRQAAADTDRNPGYERIPFDLNRFGLRLLVVDTGHGHRLADGGYARRRAECAAAAASLGVESLRDIGSVAELSGLTDTVLRRRAHHVVTENARVRAVADLLRGGADPREIGPLLTAGHVSLRDDFAVSVPVLDAVVDAAVSVGAYGARMVGGGFGGSVIVLVDAATAEPTAAAVRDRLSCEGFPVPRIFGVVAARGAGRVE